MAAKRKGAKKNAPREPNGRISRAKRDQPELDRLRFEEGPQQTVLQARRRQKRGIMPIGKATAPVSKAEAQALNLNERGTVLGRLCADGHITAQEREAGDNFCARYVSYARLNGLPNPNPKCASLEGQGGKSTRPDRISAAVAAKAAHMIDAKILRHCSAGVTTAVMRACVRESEAPLHQVKEGLAALVKAGR